MHRRNFVKASGLGVTALSASRVLGANDRLNLALIGCGGRGRGVARTLRDNNANVAYTAVADVYTVNAGLAREWAGADAKSFQDFRKVLESNEAHGDIRISLRARSRDEQDAEVVAVVATHVVRHHRVVFLDERGDAPR